MKKLLFITGSIFLAAIFTTDALKVGAARGADDVNQKLPELVLQTGHSKSVTAVVFAPGKQWIASGGSDGTIKIWDAAGRELRELSGHNGSIKSLSSSADGRFLASGSNDRTIVLWNVESGRAISTFVGHSGSVESVALSPDGKLLASGGSDRLIKIWETATGKQLNEFAEHADWVTALAFSPDGPFLASGSSDKTVKIWDVAGKRRLQNFKGHADRIKALAFSPDGNQLASGSFDETVRLWNNPIGKKPAAFAGKRQIILAGRAGRILALSYVGENKLQSASADRIIKVWDASLGREIQSTRAGNDIDGADELESAAFSADGKTFAAGRGDGTVVLFDAVSGRRMQTLKNQTSGIYTVAFSPNNRYFAAGSSDNTIKLWDLQSGQNLPSLKGHTGYITGVVFHPDGKRIVSASVDNTIKIWDLNSESAPRTLEGHVGNVSAIAVSRRGLWLVSGGIDKTVKLWNLETGRRVRDYAGHTDEITAVAISPDEKLIASGSADNTINLWDAGGESAPRRLQSDGAVESVAFSPDGKLIAAAGEDKSVRIWESATGRLIRVLTKHSGKVRTISFSTDGQRLASGGEDKTLRIWNVSSGLEERVLESQPGTISATAFSVSGEWLASGGEDGSVVFWRAKTGDKAITLISSREGGDWLATTPKGFFDGSPQAWNKILWRFEGNSFNVQPVEVFFNEFYRPGLLKSVFEGDQPKSPRDISTIDRRQPSVKIDSAQIEAAPLALRSRQITVEAEEAPADKSNNLPAGEVRDLRLFRNGSLVKVWRGKDIDELRKQAGCQTLSETENHARRIACRTTVSVVAGENNFTAYAFNRDNVKSADAEISIKGADSLKRQGTLYILVVGVNRYANQSFNLKFAVSDAEAIGGEIARNQSKLSGKQYAETKVVLLADERATKANVVAALEKFGGGGREFVSSAVPELAEIKQTQPEDGLIVYFAGHGLADKDRFYLIPHDGIPDGFASSGKTDSAERQRQLTREKRLTDQNGLEQLFKQSLSDLELENLLETVDAGKIMLVIDACNSGQALEAEEKRRGPMNSRGLAQLAYEKGMNILTASQSFQSAREATKLNHGLLTFALLEGMSKGDENNDKTINDREWLDYAATAVPLLQIETEKTRLLTQGKNTGKLATEPGELQTPRIFYRRERDANPLIIALSK